MCKSKLSVQVVDPKPTMSSSRGRSPRFPSRSNADVAATSGSGLPRSAGKCDSSSNSNSDSYNNYYPDSYPTSSFWSTSRTSLSTLKTTLAESPHIYDFSEIRSATNNLLSKPFSSSSTSKSWRCALHGKDVVVFQRKLRRKIEFSDLQSKLSLICRSHHSSLCKLHGVSISGSYIYLVYDYVHGVNLSACLRNPKNREFTVLSTWASRIQVATDIAHGLEYIHHSSGLESGFVHNHIKCSSIIVTEPKMNATICHFGTAELSGEISEAMPNDGDDKRRLERSGSNNMKFEGCRGYMAPEFQVTGSGTKETDVYSFGAVLLELLSGDEMLRFVADEGSIAGYRRVSLIETAKKAIEEKSGQQNSGLRKWIDRRLKDSYPVDVAEKTVKIGLECLEEDPRNRPDMSSVAARISQLYMMSWSWADKFGVPVDFSVSLAPR